MGGAGKRGMDWRGRGSYRLAAVFNTEEKNNNKNGKKSNPEIYMAIKYRSMRVYLKNTRNFNIQNYHLLSTIISQYKPQGFINCYIKIMLQLTSIPDKKLSTYSRKHLFQLVKQH